MFKSGLLNKYKENEFFEKIDLYFANFIASLNNQFQDEIFLITAFLSKKSREEGKVFVGLKEITSEIGQTEIFSDLKLAPFFDWEGFLRQAHGFSAKAYTPIIFTKDANLYLYRYWEYEKEINLKINQLASIDHASKPSDLKLSGNDFWQNQALLLALKKDFLIITGGPGTGKTTIIIKILDLFSELGLNLRTVIAAPTGKAAQRITQNLSQHDSSVKSEMPLKKAITIHRLLGAKNYSSKFTYNQENKLPYDLFIIDEASMIDLPLFYQLILALPDQSKLILLGDKNQLGPVNIGSVFSDLCEQKSLTENIVELKENYRLRANPAILKMSQSINQGNDAGFFELCNQGNDLNWQTLPNFVDLKKELEKLVLPF
ncbi:MAG: AAA family ATPase, partial [Candidatus Margulisiibacteriota bacterium]